MSRLDHEIRVTPSLLDRLIDYEPASSQEAPKSRSTSLHELKQSIQRDLEWILNTRAYAGIVSERLEEVHKSVALYGMPDFTGMGVESHLEQRRMSDALKTALSHFEPRFLDLKVSLEPTSKTDKALKFRIEANLNIEPSPVPIAFDTVLELGDANFKISEA